MAEMVSARLHSIPFDDVFSFDSADRSATSIYSPDPALLSSFLPNKYRIPWEVSKASATLISIDDAVKNAGFSGFRVDVTYVRRDSSAASAIFGPGVEDYVPFDDLCESSPRDGVDCRDPNVQFVDRDGDHQYYGVSLDGRPEVPDTGLKHITVAILKGGAVIASRRGNLLCKGGFSGEEISTAESPLKIDIAIPKRNTIMFQAISRLRPHLELPTIRWYPPGYFGYSGFAVRVDMESENVCVDKNANYNISPMANWYSYTPNNSGNGTCFNGNPQSFVKFSGITEPGGVIRFYVRPNSSYPTTGTEVDSSPVGALVGKTFTVQNELDVLTTRLTIPGKPEVRTWKTGGTLQSPVDIRQFLVDDSPPRMVDFFPNPALSPVVGRSPAVGFNVTETGSPQSGLYFPLTAISIRKTDDPSWDKIVTWSGRTLATSGPYQNKFTLMDSGSGGSSQVVVLIDMSSDFRFTPPEFPAGTYEFRAEFGDKAGYKSSHTWTAAFPEVTPDSTPPNIIPRSTLPLGWSTRTLLRHPTDPLNNYPTVPLNSQRELTGIRFEDMESGIDFKSVRIQCCKDDLSGCHDILRFPTTVPAGGSFGNYFDYRPSTQWTRSPVVHTFSSSGPTHFTSAFRRIQISVKNWDGDETILNDWRVWIP